MIIAIIIPFEKLYYKTINESAQIISDFIATTQFTPTELTESARPVLESFGERLLAQLPDAGFPHDATRIRTEYREKFRRRLDGALRDVEIGFIGGRRITAAPAVPSLSSGKTSIETEATAAKLSDAVILKPTFMGMGIDLQKAWQWIWNKWCSVRRR